MSFDLTWLLESISHPLFISISSAIAGAVVGGLFIWIVFIRQINWEVMTKHFEDLKKNVVEPWLNNQSYTIDKPLFNDLLNEHYPELKTLQGEFVEAQEKEEKEEKAFKEKINERLEALLKRAKIKFQREYKSISDVCFSSHIAQHIHRILEYNKWYANILTEPDPSANLSYVKIDGTEVFRTSDEAKANKIRDELDKIIKALVINPDLNEQMRNVKKMRSETWDKKNKLINILKEVKMKSKLKLRKKFGIFPRPCKYLKP